MSLDANTSSVLGALRRTYRRNTQQDAVQAILGDESGRVSVDGQPEYYYVRIANGEDTTGSTQYGRAFPVLAGAGYNGSERVGTAIYIGFAYDGQLAILGTDRQSLVEQGKNPRAENTNSVYRNFQYMKNADLFLAKPLNTVQTPGFEVRVEPSFYIDENDGFTMFPGGVIDLTSDVPSVDGDDQNQHLISGIFINSSGVLESVTSTAKSVGTALTWDTDIVEVWDARSARAFPIRYYKLYSGQTLLTEADDFGDAREWITAPKRKNNYTAIIAPTVNDDIDLGYEVGSLWFDTVTGRLYTCYDATDGAADWGATSFTALSDTPSSYSGEAGHVPSVNAGETALEFTSDIVLDGTSVILNKPTSIEVTGGNGLLSVEGDTFYSSITLSDSGTPASDATITYNYTSQKLTISRAGAQINLDVNGMSLNAGADINEFSTDGTLGDDSDDAVPTEKAVKTYVDASGGGSDDGWVTYSTVIPTRASADDPTYVLTFAAVDLTSTMSVGMKIKWTQNSTVRYGIITAIAFSTNTTLTLYGGTDYDVDDTGTYVISDFAYSTAKTPLDFPMSRIKWTYEVSDSTDRTQSSPVAGTWYNLGSFSMDVPIGHWVLEYNVGLWSVSQASQTNTGCFSSLSTSASSESDSDMRGFSLNNMPSGTLGTGASVQMAKDVILTSKTTYYLITSTPYSNMNTLFNYNSTVKPAKIRAYCGYL